MDAITNSTLIPPISKIDTAPISYLNTSIILLSSTPPTRSSTTITTISITISTLTTKIKSIYYPPPN